MVLRGIAQPHPGLVGLHDSDHRWHQGPIRVVDGRRGANLGPDRDLRRRRPESDRGNAPWARPTGWPCK